MVIFTSQEVFFLVYNEYLEVIRLHMVKEEVFIIL